jgi:hypothetical protein
MAYQILDDLSDQTSDAGKCRPNYATFAGLQQARRRMTALLEEAAMPPKSLGIDTSLLDDYAQTLIRPPRPASKVDADSGGALNAL